MARFHPSRTPRYRFIQGAAGGTRCWTTGADTSYRNSDTSYLLSPCFDFSAQTADPRINFALNFYTEPRFDGGWLLGANDQSQDQHHVVNRVEPWVEPGEIELVLRDRQPGPEGGGHRHNQAELAQTVNSSGSEAYHLSNRGRIRHLSPGAQWPKLTGEVQGLSRIMLDANNSDNIGEARQKQNENVEPAPPGQSIKINLIVNSTGPEGIK